MQLLVVAIALGILVGVVALTAVQLRGRGGRWVAVGAAAFVYLVLGNIVSRLLVGVIYPTHPGASGVDPAALQLLQVVHSVVSMGSAAAIVLVANAGLRRVLPRTGASRT